MKARDWLRLALLVLVLAAVAMPFGLWVESEVYRLSRGVR